MSSAIAQVNKDNRGLSTLFLIKLHSDKIPEGIRNEILAKLQKKGPWKES
jgi:hypothetical protein